MLPTTQIFNGIKMNAVRRRLGSRDRKSSSKSDVTEGVGDAEMDALGPFIHQAAKVGNAADLRTALSRTTGETSLKNDSHSICSVLLFHCRQRGYRLSDHDHAEGKTIHTYN